MRRQRPAHMVAQQVADQRATRLLRKQGVGENIHRPARWDWGRA
jgi:hypothetical protein